MNNAEKMESVDPAGSAARLNDLSETDLTKVSKQELPSISAEEVKSILEKNTRGCPR